MKLRDVIDAVEACDESLCIVAKRPWSADCEADIVPFTNELRVPQSVLDAGYEYFMGVETVRDEVLKSSDFLTPERRFEAVLYYAENDSFPDWLTELRRGRR